MMHGKWSLPFVPRGRWYAPLYLEHRGPRLRIPRSLYQQQLVTSLTDLLANINRGLCGYAILLHDRYRGCARPSKKEEEGEGYTGHVRVEKRRREKGIGS